MPPSLPFSFTTGEIPVKKKVGGSESLIHCKLVAVGDFPERCESPVNQQELSALGSTNSSPSWEPCLPPTGFTAESAENQISETDDLTQRHLKPTHMPLWKRTFDLTFAVLAVPILGVLTLIMMGLMKICSPGPVFFTQERVGLKGRRFKIYKFRTMYVGADTRVHQAYFTELMESRAPMVKLDAADARLIPCGRLIRASGLDELPQLINVLLGDMSIIGPRPCLPSEYEHYLPWQQARFNATPGLTGLWQVSGKNHTTFEEMIRMDIEYSQTRSPLLDARIVFMTIPAILTQLSEAQSLPQKNVVAAMRTEPRLTKVLSGKP